MAAKVSRGIGLTVDEQAYLDREQARAHAELQAAGEAAIAAADEQ
ncbi:MAG TPA: hypothetical protein VF624_14995 [Tepidisphaeraceae bacterium]|jgi:hypothetical protein